MLYVLTNFETCSESDQKSLILFQNDVAPLPCGNNVEGSTLFIRILSFLDEMAKDQVLDNICKVYLCKVGFSFFV